MGRLRSVESLLKEVPCIGNDTASTSDAGHLHFEMHLGCGKSIAGVDA